MSKKINRRLYVSRHVKLRMKLLDKYDIKPSTDDLIEISKYLLQLNTPEIEVMEFVYLINSGEKFTEAVVNMLIRTNGRGFLTLAEIISESKNIEEIIKKLTISIRKINNKRLKVEDSDGNKTIKDRGYLFGYT